MRGVDSSGIASIDLTKSEYETQKLPIPGFYFTSDAVAKRLISGAMDAKTLTMCHVRAATVGHVNTANAHPFVHEREDGSVLIGAHNGTLSGWKSQKGASDYGVDSEWALAHIAEENYDAFEDFRGAFCFTWWDSDNPEVLNIARNDQRPMYVVMLETGGMAYASEAGMLYWLLERHKVKMDGPVLELEADYWYKFNINDVADYTKVKLPKTTYTQTTSNYRNNYYNNNYKSHVDKVKELLAKYTKKEGTTKPDARNQLISQEEYEEARSLNVLGKRVEFEPELEWEDGVLGTVIMEGASFDAVIRGFSGDNQGVYSPDWLWNCNVRGVQDNGEDITLLLSPPVSATKRVGETVH